MKVNVAIKETIEYAKKFKSHLNRDELSSRLLSKKVFSKKIIMEATKIIKNKKDEYYPSKYKKAKKISKKIEKSFKDIIFLGISGSVASGHPKKNDDIDFVVITKNNRLWKTRFLLRWWIFKNKIPHRKYGKKEKKDEFCFNLWLDESSLLLPKNKNNVRSAVDLILLKPLINKKQIYENFILANSWAKKWVATPYSIKIKDIRYKMLDMKVKQNKFDEFINYLYFWPQYWYMKRKINKQTIGLHQAFFHERMVK